MAKKKTKSEVVFSTKGPGSRVRLVGLGGHEFTFDVVLQGAEFLRLPASVDWKDATDWPKSPSEVVLTFKVKNIVVS